LAYFYFEMSATLTQTGRRRRPKTGGRRAIVTTERVAEVGRRLGLPGLTVPAVAQELGVSATAVYRHVPNREALEVLVGESLLSELTLDDDATHDVRAHLVAFAEQLHDFALARPGVAAYLMRRFPRGPSGTALLGHEVEALAVRGYDDAAAIVLASSVATLALGQAVHQELRAHDPVDEEEALQALAAQPRLLAAAARLPQVDEDRRFHLLMTGVVDGLVAAMPPGLAVADLVGEER
jgi:AcrR family transcriptional regulator